MGEILSLEPEGIEKRIHPRALEHFRKFQDDVRFAVPLEEITEADLNDHLRDDEKPEFQRYINQITDGLRTCMDIGDEDSRDNQTKLLLFELNTIIPMYWVTLLLERVYDRKVKSLREEQEKREEEERRQAAKAEEERKKKDEEEQWHVAYKALDVPDADAQKNLEPEELDRFIKSIGGAVRAYMDKGESYTDDSRANNYLFYCDEIKRRKDKEQRKLAAAESARLFSDSLNEKINKLKASLYPQKQSPTKYFGKDSRYIGQRFLQLISHDARKTLADTVQGMVKEKLNDLVSDDLSDFIDYEYTNYYRFLPTADYSQQDIACLDFSFEVEVVVEVKLQLKPGKKSFQGYVFDLPVVLKGDYAVPLQEPEFLGYHYLHFTHSELPVIFWQSIPLLLIHGFLEGELEPAGATIVVASETEVIYEVKDLEDAVIIPTSFVDYLKAMGGIDSMASKGILAKPVVNIVLQRLEGLGTALVPAASEGGAGCGYTDEEYISKMASLYYTRKDSEILLQHMPENLSLDEAVKWSLKHYSEIIPENPTSE